MLGTKPGLDFTGRHGPVFAAFNGTLGAAALAMVAELLTHRFPGIWLWVTAPAILGCITAVVDGALKGRHGVSLAYRAACWIGAGVWMMWAVETSPWRPSTLLVLAGAGMCAGILGPQLLNMERREKERSPGMFASTGGRLAIEWEQRIERVTNLKSMAGAVKGVEMWPSGMGYSVEVQMPLGGASWRTLSADKEGLEADARLGEGCGIDITGGENRSVAIIDVRTKNALADDRDFPQDYSPMTINNPLPLGVYSDSSFLMASMLDHCALLVGQTGSGKTNQEQVFNAQLTRCVDALVWHIDKTGAIAVPWLTPWKEGRCDRPVIDWVATTTAEMLLMCDFAIRVIDYRKRGYVERKRAADDDKLPVDPTVPAIVIVVDEFAELPQVIKSRLESIINTGRGARVRVVLCALRPTADILDSVNILKQTVVRIGMRVSDTVEYDYLFGYSAAKGLSEDDVPYPGCGVAKAEVSGKARVFKGFRLRPSQIDAVAVAVAPLRPGLDEASMRQPGGTEYVNRWERAEHLFNVDAVAVGAPPRNVEGESESGMNLEPDGDPSANELLARADEVQEKLRREVEPKPELTDFEAIVEQLDMPEAQWPGDDPSGVSDVRDRALALLREAGPGGSSPETVARKLRDEGHTTVRQTVDRWFRDELKKPGGVVVKLQFGTYAHRDALR